MKGINRLINLINLFWINIKRNFIKEVIMGLGVIISTVTLVVGVFLGDILERLHKESILGKIPTNEIKIKGKVTIGTPDKKISVITPNFISKIKLIPHVKDVIAIHEAHFPSTLFIKLNIGLFTGNVKADRTFLIEPQVVGIPNSIAQKYINSPSIKAEFPKGFKRHNNITPILIPNYVRYTIESFNKNNNLPNFDPIRFRNMLKLKLVMNRSLVLSSKKPVYNNIDLTLNGVVVGFTDISITNGIAIPIDELERIKKIVLPNQPRGYDGAIIKTKDGYTNMVNEQLEPLLYSEGLSFDNVLSFRSLSHYIYGAVKSFNIAIFIFVSFILLLSALTVSYAFLYLIIRRSKEIGLYRFFGGTKREIISIIVLESTVIAVLCGTIGYFISHYIIYYIPNNFEEIIKLIPKSIFNVVFPDGEQVKSFKDKVLVVDHIKNIYLSIIPMLVCIISAFTTVYITSSRSIFKQLNRA